MRCIVLLAYFLILTVVPLAAPALVPLDSLFATDIFGNCEASYPCRALTFGQAVATSGNLIVVAAPNQQDNNTMLSQPGGDGMGYLFECPNSFTNCTYSVLRPFNRTHPNYDFGTSVAMEGSLVVVGAPGYPGNPPPDGHAISEGGAFVYNCANPKNCTQIAILDDPASYNQPLRFGETVSISGTTVVIGGRSPKVHIFSCAGLLSCTFQSTVSNDADSNRRRVSMLGSRLVIGIPISHAYYQYGGKAVVYDCSDLTNCQLKSTLISSSAQAFRYEGDGVSQTGNYVFVASSQINAVYVYDCTNPTSCVEKPTMVYDPPGIFGSSHRLSASGSLVLAGSQSGAQLFDCSTGTCARIETMISAPVVESISAVSLKGGLALVGDYNPQFYGSLGQVHIYAAVCPGGSSASASWPQTVVGFTGTYTCQPNYYASNLAVPCVQNKTEGYWGSANPCTRVICAAGSSGNSSWTNTDAGTQGTFTCAPGYYSSNPVALCVQEGATGYWSSYPCLPVHCPAGSGQNATWSQTMSQTSTQLTCDSGYYSVNSTATCIQSGAFAAFGLMDSPCNPVYCSGGSSDNATWTSKISGTSTNFTCTLGYYSSNPLVPCIQTGATAHWGAITVPCTPVYCNATTESHASWQQTLSGLATNGTCLSGYFGSPSRDCVQNGPAESWGGISEPCEAVYCSSGVNTNSSWGETLSGTSALQTCHPGFYSGNPVTPCVQDANTAHWGSIAEPCLGVYCDPVNFDNAAWPQAQDLGTNFISGDCNPGYFGSPFRLCNQNQNLAAWGSVVNSCQDCACDVNGSTSTSCSSIGRCQCKLGYEGDQCNNCSPTYHQNGTTCIPCGCGVGDTGSHLCNSEGECSCAVNFSDKKCTVCVPGYVVKNGDCVECGCDATGSNSTDCSSSGQCMCNDGYAGLQCSVCKAGHAGPTCEACPSGTYQDLQNQDSCLPCQANSESSNGSLTCTCLPGFTDSDGHCITLSDLSASGIEQWLPYAVYGAYFVVVFAAFLFIRFKVPTANNTAFLTTAMALFDFATSCVFVWEMYSANNNEALFIASAVALGVAFFVNVSLVFYLILTELKDSLVVEEYISKYSWIVAISAFLAGANFGVMSLLNSGIMNSPMFKIGWDPRTEIRVSTFGLVGNMVDDIPKFVIQIFAVSRFGSSSPIAILSLVATSVSIVLSLIRRGFMFLVLKKGPTARAERAEKARAKTLKDSKTTSEMQMEQPEKA